MPASQRPRHRLSPRQNLWGAATTIGTIGLWSWLAVTVGVPTVWVVVFILVAGVNMAVALAVAYCARRDATRPEGQRAASRRRGPNVYVEDIAVKMLTGMSFPSRAKTSTTDVSTSTTVRYQEWGYRLSLIAQCGLWPLVATIVFFTWHEPIPAWSSLLMTIVATPWATWQIVKELRSDGREAQDDRK
jgi:hypothetical protein